jgi:hypothetical protein
MDPLLRWIETSAFSVWARESTSVFAYPAFLSAHAIGMGLVVGVGMAVALRWLGWAAAIPPRELRRLLPLVVIGVVLNTVSGLILLAAYPTKAATNPVFYLKLGFIAVGSWSYILLHRRLGSSPAAGSSPRPASGRGDSGTRWLAVVSLASWAGAITAGRLLAYTYHRLFVDF